MDFTNVPMLLQAVLVCCCFFAFIAGYRAGRTS